MRESIGGGWLFSVVVLFIVLFSSYLAISINYSKAFKVKNYILSTIERREGYNGKYSETELETVGKLGSLIETDENAQTEIYSYLKEFGYYSKVIKSGYCEDKKMGITMPGGYCVKHICNDNEEIGGNYYKVTTFLKIEFPLIKFVLKVPVSGETKLVYYDKSSVECDSIREEGK